LDPLTHALTGALTGGAVAWGAGAAGLGRRALLLGAAAGLMPDLDVLIRSAEDPLLLIEHHRGFTHSLAFVPVGGAVSAALLRRSAPFRWVWLCAAVAWLSHALLDASATYGTQLFWPFSRHRVGLDIISIIDPGFTLIVLAGVVAVARARPRLMQLALILAVLWLAIGFVQRERASAAQLRLAAMRGETIERGAVFPTVGNTIVWRSLYRSGGMLRMDRIRVPWLGASRYAEGPTVAAFRGSFDDPRARRDLARFAWFSDHWLAADPADPTFIGDARYSLTFATYRPVWGIRLAPSTTWVDRSRERRERARPVWREILEKRPAGDRFSRKTPAAARRAFG
jgi:inner membrane protein